jgi:hypothetical protein
MINIKEEYELYIEFENIEYVTDMISRLQGAFYYGPLLLTNLVQIDEEDSIILDFSHQHKIISPDPDAYMVELSWKGLEHLEDGKYIKLKECLLKYKKLGVLKDITPDNFILIDTFNHREETHSRYPTYKSWLLSQEGAIL